MREPEGDTKEMIDEVETLLPQQLLFPHFPFSIFYFPFSILGVFVSSWPN